MTINQNGENDIKLTNKEVVVKDGETILNILAHGNKLRRAAQTNMNETSSRSHAIFRIVSECSADCKVQIKFRFLSTDHRVGRCVRKWSRSS